MKRILILIFTLLLLLALSACDTGNDTSGSSVPDTSAATDPIETPNETDDDETKVMGLNFPKIYETTRDGITTKVEFSEEYCEIGAEFSIKITITNNCDLLLYEDGVVYVANEAWGYLRKYCECECMCNCTMFLEYECKKMISDPTPVSWYADTRQQEIFPIGESRVFERAFFADPSFFSGEGTYTFFFCLPSYDSDYRYGEVEIPIKYVEMP